MKIDGQLQWSAQMPLWNAREGRSDLTVELTIYDDHGIPKVEIDGIATL
jgi:hypothetical protein